MTEYNLGMLLPQNTAACSKNKKTPNQLMWGKISETCCEVKNKSWYNTDAVQCNLTLIIKKLSQSEPVKNPTK